MTDFHPDHHIACQYALYSVCDMPTRAEGGGAARQQTGAHLPPGKTDQGPPAPGSRRQVHRPRRLPSRAERLHPQSAGADSSAARRHRDRPWRPMPVSSTARYPGPSSGRDTSSYAWENATPLSGCRMPEGSLRRPSTCAVSSAYSSRPSSRRPRSRSLHRCPQVDSPGRAPSSLVPTAAPLNQHKENAHDHHD